MCIAVAVPPAETCEVTESCPTNGPHPVWAGEWLAEPIIVAPQGCEAYPTLDICVAASPDERCACACAAGYGA